MIKNSKTFTPETARQFRQTSGNPIAGLVPVSLTSAINDFQAGYLRTLALIYDRLEAGADPDIQTNAHKRRDSVAFLPWEIVLADNLEDRKDAEAQRHREALLHTFNHLTVLDATEPEAEGEVRQLVDNILRAKFLRYSIHEKIYAPHGRDLDLSLIHTPVSFWENTTGPLRYAGPMAMMGTFPADREGFLVAHHGTLAIGLAVCWMYGSQTLKDWLEFNAGFMLPGIHAKTSHSKNSEEWNNLRDALGEMIAQWVLMTGKDDEVEIITPGANGGSLAEPLFEAMQRAKITLCLGSDLSTMSRRNSQGASVQQTDTNDRIRNDARFVEDVINRGLVRQIISYTFGPQVQPLAWFRLRAPMDRDDTAETAKDKFLMNAGVPFSIEGLADKYGHSLPNPKDTLINPPAAPSAQEQTPAAPTEPTTVANEKPAPDSDLRAAVRRDLQPLRELLASALQNDGKGLEAADWDATLERVMDGEAIAEALNGEWLAALMKAAGASNQQIKSLITEVTTPKNTDA